jgi:hypothetical protein
MCLKCAYVCKYVYTWKVSREADVYVSALPRACVFLFCVFFLQPSNCTSFKFLTYIRTYIHIILEYHVRHDAFCRFEVSRKYPQTIMIPKQSWFTNNHDSQTIMIHKQSWCTNNHDSQTIMIHKQAWFPNNHDSQTIMIHKQAWFTNNHDSQTIMMHKQASYFIIKLFAFVSPKNFGHRSVSAFAAAWVSLFFSTKRHIQTGKLLGFRCFPDTQTQRALSVHACIPCNVYMATGLQTSDLHPRSTYYILHMYVHCTAGLHTADLHCGLHITYYICAYALL